MARPVNPLPLAARRQLLDELYRVLLRAPAESKTAPTDQVGAVDVESPQLQTEGADDMDSIAYAHASVKDGASDRALGAEAHPGLGARPAPRVEVGGEP